MATKKSATKSSKVPGKKAARPPSTAAKIGALPPYGVAIREAVSRGDSQEMKKAGVSGRKWLKEIQTALAQLEKALAQKK